MSVAGDLNSIRHQLAALAERSKCRVTEFTPQRPTHWSPHTICSPDTGLPLTDAAAWLIIVDALRNPEVEIEEIELHSPPGKKAYVMRLELHPGETPVYIKLQLGSGKVIGRSFHYCTIGEAR